MSSPGDVKSLRREDLLALVAELQRQVTALQKQVAELAASNQELRAEMERMPRQSHRQAAPFSKGTHTKQPKRPGRKPGEGTFSFRQAPRSEEITEPPVDVRVTLESCPSCGGKLNEHRMDFAYVTELPSLPRPRVTQYRVWVCRCSGCARQVRAEHPDLAPDQYGATAHRVGPRAMAAAHALHYQVGIPVRKVPLILDLLTGMELTQGAITQDALRRARGAVGAAYQELRHSVRDSPAVYTDDTGWKVGGENAHLMAFDTDQAPPPGGAGDSPEELPGGDGHRPGPELWSPFLWQGQAAEVPGPSPEDPQHPLEKKRGRAREFGEKLKMLLGMAMDLWEEYQAGETEDFEARAAELRFVISYLLRERALRDPDNRHLLKVVRRYHQLDDLLRFLEDPSIEPTNNRVERALRPAVIARKVSQCSKNEAGANAFSAFKSVVQTLVKRGTGSVVEALYTLFRSPKVQLAPG
jgi:transposase